MGVAISQGLRPAHRCEHRSLRGDDMALVAVLPLFAALPADALLAVISEAVTVRYAPREPLFHQGEDPRYLHIMLEGQVGLMGAASSGEETIVEILKSGEGFIAAAVLTGRPYLMSAVALYQARVLQLPGERLIRDLRASPDLAVAMLTSLSTSYRKLVREVKDLKLKSASQRLALYLMGLTAKRAGPTVVRLPHNKGLIASRIGIRAETLSRAFAALGSVGVEAKGPLVVVADLCKLAIYCQEGDELI